MRLCKGFLGAPGSRDIGVKKRWEQGALGQCSLGAG